MPKDSIKPLEMTAIESTTLTVGTLRVINSAGFEGAPIMLRITNGSDKFVTISFDGVTDHIVVLAGSSVDLNFQTNSRPGNNVALLPKGTKLYAAGTAGQAGFIYVSGFYQD